MVLVIVYCNLPAVLKMVLDIVYCNLPAVLKIILVIVNCNKQVKCNLNVFYCRLLN
jgi:hypothetical protein